MSEPFNVLKTLQALSMLYYLPKTDYQIYNHVKFVF